ncbi:MAG TPA: hypothetical protein VLJ38_22365 [Polyangiaceae bacterium]|nr:hypothetical protein [Polyangiaceae bacterium]
MVPINEGKKGLVIVDNRYGPLIVSTFVGEVELSQGLWYERTILDVIGREAAGGRRVVSIHDASRVTKTSAEMRRFWADLSARHSATLESRTLANVIVVSSPLMRGVLTAVGWMNPKVAALKLFPTLDTAVAEAQKLLRAAGTPVTIPAGGYRLPEQGSIAPGAPR